MSKTILSIQSHVAHGYVGGKAAVFPLQTQGWEVDYINTVNFSNHTGYGSVKGAPIDPEELTSIMEQLGSYKAVITGYIPNAQLIATIHKYIVTLKNRHDADSAPPLYLLDPVMGDNNYLYVDKDCIEQNKNVLEEKVVDIITPNQFELELLVGYKIESPNDLASAISTLHTKYGVRYVVITSLDGTLLGNSNVIGCAVSTSNSSRIQVFEIPIIKSYFTGVGDLFSALLLDKLVALLETETSDPLVIAVNQVLSIMSKTLRLTHRLALEDYKAATSGKSSNKPLEGSINDGDTMKYFELRVIQARDYFDYSGPGDYVPKTLKY